MERLRKWKREGAIQGIWEKYSTYFLMLILTVCFYLRPNDYISAANLQDLFLGGSALVIVVFGVSLVMIMGGIDLSVGYQISLVSVAIAGFSRLGLPDWLVISGALLAGGLCGLLNGILVTVFDIVPFAATIATQIIFRGASYYLSNGRMVSYIPDTVRNITRYRLLNIRGDVWIMLLVLLLFAFILHFSFFGKYMRAIGLNEKSAERAGVKVKQIKCASYCLAGLLYGVASIIMTSTRGYAGSEIGIGMEITAIAAAYIGGLLKQPEKPNVITLFLGAVIVGMITNRLPKAGVNSYIQYIFTGLILIVAIGIHKKRK